LKFTHPASSGSSAELKFTHPASSGSSAQF
jgi:hypothetical protein